MSTSYRPLLLTLLVAAVGLFASGCAGADGSNGEDAPEQRRVRVETLVLDPTLFEDVIELTGAVEALDDAVLSAQTSGTLTALADLGQRVGRGTVVARIDPGMMAASVQQAEANVEATQAAYDIAQDTFERQEPLYQDSVISALEFENVKAQRNQALARLRQAQAALGQAREQYAYTIIRAPFAGTVEAHFAEMGEQVNPGQRVVRIVDAQRVQVAAGVPERYAGEIEVGTPVTMNFSAYGTGERTGRVTFAGAAINPQSRTFPVEIDLPNPEGRLKPEMVAQVYVTRTSLDDALVIPRAAVIRDETGTSVFVVRDQDGMPTARRQPVELGASYAGKSVVEGGLEAGDEVVVLGQNNLTDGDAVNVVEQYGRVGAAGVPLRTGEDQPAL